MAIDDENVEFVECCCACCCCAKTAANRDDVPEKWMKWGKKNGNELVNVVKCTKNKFISQKKSEEKTQTNFGHFIHNLVRFKKIIIRLMH